MKELGGYIELDKYKLPMLYNEGIKLNCARNAFAYIIEAKKIENIYIPYFLCDSCNIVLSKYSISIHYYNIESNFKPIIDQIPVNSWVYIVNYYGQLSEDDIRSYSEKYNVILDNTHAYFQEPIGGIDTLYSCRKFFGVSDGAILFTDKLLSRQLDRDTSFDRMRHLLGRVDGIASDFYMDYVKNNDFFKNEPIKEISKLTDNLLHGIDYDYVKKQRIDNYNYIHSKLKDYNKLNVIIPKGPFMYPLYVNNGNEIRKKLCEIKIYVPLLWPNVIRDCDESSIEFDLAMNILPLPIDQRYSIDDMEYIVQKIFDIM